MTARARVRLFLGIVALVVVAAIVLAAVAVKARPHTAHIARYHRCCSMLVAVIVLFPIYITVVNSLLNPTSIAARPPTSSRPIPHWGTYRDAWNGGHIGAYLRNSFIVTLIIVAGQLLTSILAAYAFAFLEFPFKRTIFVLFLATMMIPFEVVFFTNLETVVEPGDVPRRQYIGFNTYGALASRSSPPGFGAFLIRQAFLSLPRDLRDAAALDGYGHWRFIARVAVPLARPTVAALASSRSSRRGTSTCGRCVVTRRQSPHGAGRAATAPRGRASTRSTSRSRARCSPRCRLFILLLVFQKQLVRGLTAGAVKG